MITEECDSNDEFDSFHDEFMDPELHFVGVVDSVRLICAKSIFNI